jgi:enterochelin esterase family protein
LIPTQLAALEDADHSAVESFVKDREFPLIESGKATFLFRGEAEAVSLRPMIAGFPGPHSFQQIDGTDLWWLTLSLPEGARLEYKLEVQRAHHTEWVNDPLNPLTTSNPFGTNSVCRAYGYQVPDWTLPHPDASPGSFEDLDLAGGNPLQIYLPPGWDRATPIPLVFVHDGADYLHYGSMSTVLDNLIGAGSIPPLLAVFSKPAHRLIEYAASPAHAVYVVETVVPAVTAKYAVGPQKVVMGASLGAVAALHAAWTHPGAFTAMLLQSGTFAQSPGWGAARHILGPIADLLVQLEPSALPHQVFLSCGTYERMIGENRAMAGRLQRAGLDVRYVESRDGHTWEGWRDRLAEGLAWVLTGPDDG